MLLLSVVGLSVLASALAQQCPNIDGLKSEQWLLERAAGPFAFPTHNNVTRLFAGASQVLCRALAQQMGDRAPQKSETLCVKSRVGGPCTNINVCSPGPGQLFTYPFWSELLDIADQETKNPAQFGPFRRTQVKACLTCYALAKPHPTPLDPQDPQKNSVTVSTRLACAAQQGQGRYGLTAQERAQLLRTPVQARAGFLRRFQRFDAKQEPVNGHKAALVEVPFDQARVLQTEVTLDPRSGAVLTKLPTGGQGGCSAFEYGMVVVSPGLVASACWLTPMFPDAAARAAYLKMELDAEEAIVTKKRRSDAKACRQQLKAASDGLAQVRQLASDGRTPVQNIVPGFQGLMRTVQFCNAFCRAAEASLPATHNFLRQPKAHPDLCVRKFYPLAQQAQQVGEALAKALTAQAPTQTQG